MSLETVAVSFVPFQSRLQIGAEKPSYFRVLRKTSKKLYVVSALKFATVLIHRQQTRREALPGRDNPILSMNSLGERSWKNGEIAEFIRNSPEAKFFLFPGNRRILLARAIRNGCFGVDFQSLVVIPFANRLVHRKRFRFTVTGDE